jgi:hypothetical protein
VHEHVLVRDGGSQFEVRVGDRAGGVRPRDEGSLDVGRKGCPPHDGGMSRWDGGGKGDDGGGLSNGTTVGGRGGDCGNSGCGDNQWSGRRRDCGYLWCRCGRSCGDT